MESLEGFRKDRVFLGFREKFVELDATLAGKARRRAPGVQLPCRIVCCSVELADFAIPRILSRGRAIYFDGLLTMRRGQV